jgi:hypothetical protein
VKLEDGCYYRLEFTGNIIRVLDSELGKAEYHHKYSIEISTLNWNDRFYNERLIKLSSLERELF